MSSLTSQITQVAFEIQISLKSSTVNLNYECLLSFTESHHSFIIIISVFVAVILAGAVGLKCCYNKVIEAGHEHKGKYLYIFL